MDGPAAGEGGVLGAGNAHRPGTRCSAQGPRGWGAGGGGGVVLAELVALSWGWASSPAGQAGALGAWLGRRRHPDPGRESSLNVETGRGLRRRRVGSRLGPSCPPPVSARPPPPAFPGRRPGFPEGPEPEGGRGVTCARPGGRLVQRPGRGARHPGRRRAWRSGEPEGEPGTGRQPGESRRP